MAAWVQDQFKKFKTHVANILDPPPDDQESIETGYSTMQIVGLEGESYAMLPMKLGSGSYGAVSRGKRISDDLPVAIKYYAVNETQDMKDAREEGDVQGEQQARESAIQDTIYEAKEECDKLRYLNEKRQVKGIVKLLDGPIDAPRDGRYVILELVSGKTLLDYINLTRTHRFTDDAQRLKVSNTLLDVMNELAAIVRDMNNACIIHNDLKPSNIMVRDDENSSLVVLDLGLSCYKRGCDGPDIDKLFEYKLCKLQDATVGYTPPEIRLMPRDEKGYLLQNQIPGYNFNELDAYSVGRIMLQIVTGALGESFSTEENQRRYESPEAVAFIRSGKSKLDQIIAQLLVSDFHARMSLSNAVRALQGLPALTRPLPICSGYGDAGAAQPRVQKRKEQEDDEE